SEECRNYFVHVNSVSNASAAVFRKAVYDQVGGADESLRVCGDWKLWVSMALEGRIAYLSEPLNYYREHDATVRNKIRETGHGAGEHLQMVAWMLERVTPTEGIRERAYAMASFSWIPVVLNRRIPLRRRWGLLRDALATDPNAM